MASEPQTKPTNDGSSLNQDSSGFDYVTDMDIPKSVFKAYQLHQQVTPTTGKVCFLYSEFKDLVFGIKAPQVQIICFQKQEPSVQVIGII